MNLFRNLTAASTLSLFLVISPQPAHAAPVARPRLHAEISVLDAKGTKLSGIGKDMTIKVRYLLRNQDVATAKNAKIIIPPTATGKNSVLDFIGKSATNCSWSAKLTCTRSNLKPTEEMSVVLEYRTGLNLNYGQNIQLAFSYFASGVNGGNLRRNFKVVRTDFTPPQLELTALNQTNQIVLFTNQQNLEVAAKAIDADKHVHWGRFLQDASWTTLAALPISNKCPVWQDCNIWNGDTFIFKQILEEGVNHLSAAAMDSDENAATVTTKVIYDLVPAIFSTQPVLNDGKSVTDDTVKINFSAEDVLINSFGRSLTKEEVSGVWRFRLQEAGMAWSTWRVFDGEVEKQLTLAKGYRDNDIVIVNVEIMDKAGNKTATQARSRYDVTGPQEVKDGWSRPYMGNAPITSPFGPRWGTFHDGTDYGLACGTPIYAVRDGTVIAASNAGVVLGNMSSSDTPASFIILDHGSGWRSLYWHLNKVFVQTGQKVSRGSYIGRSGNTGYVRGDGSLPVSQQGCHLHLEIQLGGTSLDPESVLP